jgi:hypothetical protein
VSIAILDPHAIAAGARDKVTAGMLVALRDLVDSAFIVPDTSLINSHEHVALANAGLAHCEERFDLEGHYDYYAISEAGRCLLAMLSEAAVEPAPAPSGPPSTECLCRPGVDECHMVGPKLTLDEALSDLRELVDIHHDSVIGTGEAHGDAVVMKNRLEQIALRLADERAERAAIGRERSGGV